MTMQGWEVCEDWGKNMDKEEAVETFKNIDFADPIMQYIILFFCTVSVYSLGLLYDYISYGEIVNDWVGPVVIFFMAGAGLLTVFGMGGA